MKKLLLLLLASGSYLFSFTQVAINTTNAPANASAMLDITSTTRGLLISRMTTAQRNAIASPANGLLVYDVSAGSFWVFKTGTGWLELVSLNLPFSATVNSANAFPNAAFRIINTNTSAGSAGAFSINSATNSGSALSTSTIGTGNAFRAEVSANTAATAIFAHTTGTSLGAAGSFINDNAANTNVAMGIISNATNVNAHSLSATTTGGGSAGVFTVNNPASVSSALSAVSNGAADSRTFIATHTGAGTAAEFSLSNPTNNSSTIIATTAGDGYAATFNNTKDDATNSGAIRAFTSASTGVGYPTVILARSDGTLGTAGFFYSQNGNNIRPTMVVRNDGQDRTLAVYAYNSAYASNALDVLISGGTVDSRGVSVLQEGLGGGVAIQASNTANTSDALNVNQGGTGIGIHSLHTNANGSAGVFEKNAPATGAYTDAAAAELEVRHPSQSIGGLTGLRIFNKAGNQQSWTFYTNNESGALSLYYKNTLVGTFATTGTYVPVSDARLKRNVVQMPDLLTRVMQLQPKTYSYTFDNSNRPMLGFLAQEVEPIFPQLVYKNTSDDKDGYYKMDYSAFGVIAVKAVQEQQKIIQGQQKEIDELKKEIAEIKMMMKSL